MEKKLKKKRIIGIDVARALAVIGMIIVNFKIVLGENGEGWVKAFAEVFNGKAAATFVVLAGVGLALMTNSAVKDQNLEKLRVARKRILKRALFLFVVGLSYYWIWPADILHFYGVYMLITLALLSRSPKQLLGIALAFIAFFPVLIMLIDYETGWIMETYTYTDFWTPEGFFRNLFFNGFHPVIPWVAFMLVGLWFGRQNLYDNQFVKKAGLISFGAFLLIQLISVGSLQLLSGGDAATLEELNPLIGTSPMPPMPLYMLNGITIAIAIISACILLARAYEGNRLIGTLNKTGQLALTFYVAHVILGMGILEDLSSVEYGAYSIEFSVGYALLFSLFCMLFAEIWLRYKKAGPLEWVMRKLTD
ncbi:MAG: DUF418 domain-containing protein [Bacteroidota bacterium]